MRTEAAKGVAAAEVDELTRQALELAGGLRGLADSITVLDQQGRIVFANESAARALGYATPQEVLKASADDTLDRFEVFDEQGLPMPVEELPGRRALAGEKPPQVTVRYRVKATGEIRWANVAASPILDAAGKVQLAVNVFHDITDQRRTEDRLRFLTEASDLLSASLDYERTLGAIAELAIPALADWCIVDELVDDRSLRRVAVAAADPAKRAVLEELRKRYPPSWDSPQPAARSLREGDAILFEEFDAETLAQTVRDAEHLELLRKLDPRSAVAVPLTAHGQTLGAITFAYAESKRIYREVDVGLARDVAARAALAVDSARLYRGEQRARMRAEAATKRLRALQAVSQVALTHIGRDDLVAELLRLTRDILESDTATILIADHEANVVVAQLAEGFEEEIGVRIPIGAGFAGRIAAERRPRVIEDIDKHTVYNPLLREKGLVSLLGVPLVVGEELIGVLHVGSKRYRLFTPEEQVTLQLVGDRVALGVDQARTYAAERDARIEAERGREQLRFLAETSELLASSLDYETTLERVARLTLPVLADCCVVDVLDEQRRVRQVAVAHIDPEKEQLVRDLERTYPTDEQDPASPVGRVLREGRTAFLPTGEGLESMARDRRHARGLKKLGIRSVIIAPLIARGQTLGAITLLRTESGRLYEETDQALAEVLARRAALAVDNARLFREAEERGNAARVLAYVGDGVFLLDRHGVVRLWNPAAEAITGLSAAAMIGRDAEEALPGWATVRERVPISPAPGQLTGRAETMPLDVGEQELWISISGVDFEEGTVYAFRDLTEERRLDELRSEFVATASHELRTPLAAVYGAAMTLRRRDLDLDDERRERLLEVISEEADRLARIVNDILWASRLDSGTLDLSLEAIDPAECARRVVEAQRAHLPQHLTLDYVVAGEIPQSLADADKVRQVLTNLIENAVKYSVEQGTIEVRVEGHDQSVRFSIRDEGIGIPPHEQRRIFEKFYRLDPNLTRGVGGTGLGLYICHELVRRMGGRIWVASRQDEGSTFYFELPAARPVGAEVAGHRL